MFLLLAACGHDVAVPPTPTEDPSAAWEARLGEVVTDTGRVDYGALHADHAALDAFVGWLAEHGPETDGFRLLDDDKRLAWHLNAYNALVLHGVLEAGDITSVRDVRAPVGRPGTGFFGWWRFRVDREPVSLRWYEQATILATYEEPLAHAAMVCASRSCPPLRRQLYREKDLKSQLDDQMKCWIRAGAARREGDTFVFNAVFDWYADDFAQWAGATNPCEVVRPYAAPALAKALDDAPACPHRFEEYDWRLNDGTAR